jgi:hypothetical protein
MKRGLLEMQEDDLVSFNFYVFKKYHFPEPIFIHSDLVLAWTEIFSLILSWSDS